MACSNPTQIGLTADSAAVYVTQQNANTVAVINAATNTLATSIVVGSLPLGIAVTGVVPGPRPTLLELIPNPVRAGKKLDAQITLDKPAGPGGVVVEITSGPEALVPTTVLVPEGKISATFVIEAAKVLDATSVVISASANQKTIMRTLFIEP